MADTIYPLMLIPGAIPLLVDLFSWIQGEIADILNKASEYTNLQILPINNFLGLTCCPRSIHISKQVKYMRVSWAKLAILCL